MNTALLRYMVKKLTIVLMLLAGLSPSFYVFAEDDSFSQNEIASNFNQSNQSTLNKNTLDQSAVNRTQFGRLFTTPKERARLDLQRQQRGFSEPISADISADTTGSQTTRVAAQPQSFKLSGVLIRADGQQQIWINGKLQPQIKNSSNARSSQNVLTSASLKVPIKPQDRYITLKPGQVWSPYSSKTTESYLLPVRKPPQIEAPVTVKKSAPKKEAIQKQPDTQPNTELGSEVEAASESTEAE